MTYPCHIADINTEMFNLHTDIQSVLKVTFLRLCSVPGKHYFTYKQPPPESDN